MIVIHDQLYSIKFHLNRFVTSLCYEIVLKYLFPDDIFSQAS